MRAIVLHAQNDLRLEDREADTPGQGEVRVRIATGGICGSDLHYYQHGGFGTVRIKQPLILGHEVSGYVEELGEGVDSVSVGDLVALSPSRHCGTCGFCQEGRQSHCENMRFFGSAIPYPHIQGAFREHVVAASFQCVPASGLTSGEAAMAEPLAVVLHALRRAGDILGKRILVTGSGPIGALTVLAARASGATDIVVTDLEDAALGYAARAGADQVINVSQSPDGLKGCQKGKGSFDVLFECSGSPHALADGIAAMRPGGVVVQLGLGGDMAIPMQILTTKELDLRGSFRFDVEFQMAVEAMQRGTIDVKPLISHTVPLADAINGFHLAADRSQAMKVNIAFS